MGVLMNRPKYAIGDTVMVIRPHTYKGLTGPIIRLCYGHPFYYAVRLPYCTHEYPCFFKQNEVVRIEPC